MKKKIPYFVAVLIGIVIGFTFSHTFTRDAVKKQRALDNRINLVSKLGDINRLIEKGYPDAATIFIADVFLQLGSVGNYYRQNNKTPTEMDWILIDPALDYLKGKRLKSMYNSYSEAAIGIIFLKNLKNRSVQSN